MGQGVSLGSRGMIWKPALCRQKVKCGLCWFPAAHPHETGSQTGQLPARKAPRAPVTVPCAFSVRRREELQSTQAAWLSQAEQYENLHLGGYRRIYPARGTEKYEPFFKQSSSLFQETVSSKAREECARYTASTETPLTGWHLLLIPLRDGSVLRRCNVSGQDLEGKAAACATSPWQSHFHTYP